MQTLRTGSTMSTGQVLFAAAVGTVLLGVLFGAVTYCFMDNSFSQQISVLYENYISFRQSSDFAEILLRSFCSAMIFLGSVFLLGLSCISQPLEVAVPFIKGIGLGVALAGVYGTNGSQGILSCAVTVLPCSVISVYALAIGTREAVLMSNRLFRNLFTAGASTVLVAETKLYGARFMVLTALTAVSAAVDCACTFLLK